MEASALGRSIEFGDDRSGGEAPHDLGNSPKEARDARCQCSSLSRWVAKPFPEIEG